MRTLACRLPWGRTVAIRVAVLLAGTMAWQLRQHLRLTEEALSLKCSLPHATLRGFDTSASPPMAPESASQQRRRTSMLHGPLIAPDQHGWHPR